MGRSQIFWECDHGLACESWPDTIPRAFGDVFGSMFRNMQEELQKINAASSVSRAADTLSVFKHYHPAPTYTLWGFVVEHCPQCKLTKPQDKLVAISGIAKLFQASLSADTYLAGLWKNNLAYGLLWRSATYEPSPLVRVPHRAPSWSWASVEGKILAEGRKYVVSDEAVFVQVVSAQTILRTADPTAQIVAGTLTLTGMLFEATFEERFPGETTPAGTLRPTIPAHTAQTINGFVYPDTELRSAFSQ
jgi:hypothetical protein